VTTIAAIGWPVLDGVHLFDGLDLPTRGLFIAVAVLLGGWLAKRQAAKRGVTADHVAVMLLVGMAGAFVGARLFWLLTHGSSVEGAGDAFAIGNGGMSLLGGIAGATIANLPLIKKFGYRFFQVADGAAAALALGIAVGRIGDLVSGSGLGKPSTWPLAFTYRGGDPPGFECLVGRCVGYLNSGRLEITHNNSRLLDSVGKTISHGTGLQQPALLEIAGAFLLFLLLQRLSRVLRREGTIACAFLAGYGAIRLATDFARIEPRLLGLTGTQWASLAIALVAGRLLIYWLLHPAGQLPSANEAMAGPPAAGGEPYDSPLAPPPSEGPPASGGEGASGVTGSGAGAEG